MAAAGSEVEAEPGTSMLEDDIAERDDIAEAIV